MKKAVLKSTARVLILTLTYQLLFPVCALALTTGPSTPEVQSFEPVGTTDMVDLFTGDFNYNIPLMDVEGFPINIAYHAGQSIEEEASWVGLGWNINPGEINRSVRGIPDDFDGETIEKTIHINDEQTYRVGMGISASLEAFGFNASQYGLNLSLDFGSYVQFDNYKGMSAGFNTGATLSTPVASAGIDIGLGSQNGADVDVNAGFHISESVSSDVGMGIGVSGGTGFNSRTGLKGFSWGASIGFSKGYANKWTTKDKNGNPITHTKSYSQSVAGASNGGSIPIGLQNYVPVITNSSVQNTFQFQARFGGEVFYVFPNVQMSISKNTLRYESDGSRKAYGYIYSEDATDNDIMDFSREKDGYYNNTLQNLPLASMTYDVYSVTGQGTGGMFRPYRNDIGTVYDPIVAPPTSTGQDIKLEGGIGDLFEVGTDLTFYENESKSGPWIKMPYRGNGTNNLYEKIFFKQGGELTYNNQQNTPSIFNDRVQYVAEDGGTLKDKYHNGAGSMPSTVGGAHIYTNSDLDRTTRANLLTYITGGDADIDDVAQSKKITSYSTGTNPFYDPVATDLDRYGTAADKAKTTHATEFTQTLADGRRYVYGIPAINHISREVTCGVSPSRANLSTGLVGLDRTSGHEDDGVNNQEGKENFYSHTATPAYAYSYLLTSVLSSDYVDVLGDGPTDDDLGSFTKINYTKWSDDYRWRAPYSNDSAQYNPGFWSDPNDDKGDYLIGSKDIWHIRSIETKNYVAEFYVSQRNDGTGIKNAILPGTSTLNVGSLYSSAKSGESYSYKLDSIKLYNKNDRYLHTTNAVPIKTVIFRYSYRLCKGIPNSLDANSSDADSLRGGKLTLERIYIRYGNSNKNLLSPYVFSYNGINPHYNFAYKDRWGNYKVPQSGITNFEYPYVNQDATDNDINAGAWNLTDIKLPSGGNIHVDYESDDYATVQDRRAMEMFRVSGVGSSQNRETKSVLYDDIDHVNNFVYFKRRISAENTALSIKDNYLEGAVLMYYSFNLDVTGTGKNEHIKGYAEILNVGKCPNDTNYGYVELKKENPGGKSTKQLHPATILGINTGRTYIPQIMYPGYTEGGALQIMYGLRAAAGELFDIGKNPVDHFIQKYKDSKNINLSKSWVRLNTPGLAKKGGGYRVKELTISDEWNELTASSLNTTNTYGKHYDYRVWSDRWNRYISSGVTSYEPMPGGDEGPFRFPIPYTSDAGRGLPATKFFQEEPFGESFFPSPVVGYSKVTVTSIHAGSARSAQSKEEHEFYTAADFPIEIEYGAKDAPPPVKTKKFRKKSEEVTVKQGYTLRFNDMHGKLKKTTYFLINTNGSNTSYEPVSSTYYKYNVDGKGKLNNVVNAVVRTRNTTNGYTIQPTTLGEEIDFTVDSRQRYNRSYSRNIDLNCNVVVFLVVPIPIPTAFFPDKEEKQTFRSLVTTKIVQRYGILKSVETYDHGAKVVSENMLYDAETGGVLLSKINNEYNDNNYDLSVPAYWAYEGMGPAYTNIDYKESGAILTIEPTTGGINTYYGNLTVSDVNRYTAGDELLLTYVVSGTTYTVKVWVLPPFQTTPTTYCSNCSTPYGTSYPYYHSPYPRDPSLTGKLRVAPRFLFKNATLQWPGSLHDNSTVSDVSIRVLRSGRRNNLDKTVEHVTMTQDPYNSSLSILLGNSSGATAYNKVLDLDVKEYSDLAFPYTSDSAIANWGYTDTSRKYYDPYMYPVKIKVGTDTLKILNRYVLGHYGNYRVLRNYKYKSDRDYSTNNIKNDGSFAILNDLFWGYYASGRTIVYKNSISTNWRKLNEMKKYDVFGNAIEEMETPGIATNPGGGVGELAPLPVMIGKLSSAQYGYNKTLPVAVASNINDNGFSFDGFEDYSMMRPEYLRSLYSGYFYYSSPFGPTFNDVDGSFTHYKQNYVTLKLVPSNGDSITNCNSHTGDYSLKCAATRTFPIKIRDYGQPTYAESYFPNIRNFSFEHRRQYIVSLWLKPTTNTAAAAATAAANTKITDNTTAHSFQITTGSIDGWYRAECRYSADSLNYTAAIQLPSTAYFDDVRFIPVDATMKSFVYSPSTLKLAAQLDENNFATFYEYDQEGLLVRVKKETDKGIMTVSESRRANSKK